MWRSRLHRTGQRGVTLLELAIVLVILGLVAGSVLVGRDLVRLATLHAAGAQSEQLKAAIMVYYDRYKCVPGDDDNADRWPDAVIGNNDGEVDELEANNVWHHLSQDGLIEGVYVPVAALPPPAEAAGVAGRIELSYVNVLTDSTFTSAQSWLYMTITGIPQPTPTFAYLSVLLANFVTNAPTGLLPADARHLDAKFDDGLPRTGTILSALAFVGPDDRVACPEISGANRYNVRSIWRTCGLWMRMPTSR